jgi:hypothetical protein
MTSVLVINLSRFVLIMDKGDQDSKQSSKEFTQVISRNITAGHEKDYDDWLKRFMAMERQFPGYIGTTIIAPGAISHQCGTLLIASLTRPRWMHGKFARSH